MADFQLYNSSSYCKISTNPDSSHSVPDDRPRRTITVQLQHRQTDKYYVYSAAEDENVEVDEKETLIGHCRFLGLEGDDTELQGNKIRAGLAIIQVVRNKFVEPIVAGVLDVIQHCEHERAIITVEFASVRNYICSEEIHDNWTT